MVNKAIDSGDDPFAGSTRTGMRAFITGATGFIGRRLVDRWCADEKQHAVCLVRPNTTGAWTDAVRAVHGYLSDSAPSLAASMNGCDIVFHLAGFISFNQADRAKLIQTNSDGAARVLEAAKMARVNRVVIVSSACTVGLSTRPEHVLNEDAPANAAL
ncbi:MAG TPA: NAD-dependent epimerase/dehydratase family protein, partial [Phycisphaerae bacterium]|nr:NAD-dependent epimerase/dehydratase family protein [Phycisphaerae bacterium]